MVIPYINFTETPAVGTAPLSVTFTNLSTGAVSYKWDFGDSTTSTSTGTILHNYNTIGTFTVSLTGWASSGSAIKTGTIKVLSTHNFTNTLLYRATYPAGTWDASQPSYVRIVYGKIDPQSST